MNNIEYNQDFTKDAEGQSRLNDGLDMNVEQALNAADESEQAGLCGLYPMAAQVLAVEVRYLRNIINGDQSEAELLRKYEFDSDMRIDAFGPIHG